MKRILSLITAFARIDRKTRNDLGLRLWRELIKYPGKFLRQSASFWGRFLLRFFDRYAMVIYGAAEPQRSALDRGQLLCPLILRELARGGLPNGYILGPVPVLYSHRWYLRPVYSGKQKEVTAGTLTSTAITSKNS